MDTIEMQMEILRLVNKHDGELSWYQLDRSLVHDDYLPIIHGLLEVLRQLEEGGHIRAEGTEPYYFITEAGRQALKQQRIAA